MVLIKEIMKSPIKNCRACVIIIQRQILHQSKFIPPGHGLYDDLIKVACIVKIKLFFLWTDFIII